MMSPDFVLDMAPWSALGQTICCDASHVQRPVVTPPPPLPQNPQELHGTIQAAMGWIIAGHHQEPIQLHALCYHVL